MNRYLLPRLGRVSVLAMVLALFSSVMLSAPVAGADEADAPPEESTVIKLTNAEFRWAINQESSGYRTHQGFNFFSAGDASAFVATAADELEKGEWKDSVGSVRIEKAPGKLATWSDMNPSGGGPSGAEMVFTNGQGEIDAEEKKASVSWKGTASVAYYSGLSFFTISDPILEIEDGTAKVFATLGGFSSARSGGTWQKLNPKSSVLMANLPAADLWKDSNGFSVAPKYNEFDSPVGKKGSFPEPFVDFMETVGISSYFYSSGGEADKRKSPSDVTVNWTAAQRVPTAGSNQQGVLGRVIGDTVEDIFRAAGTDVSDTAAVWMDEVWKPLQPDAVNAAQAGAPVTAGDSGDSGTVVEEEFAEQYEEFYTAGAPMTAGTVGATLATVTIPVSGGSSAPASAAPAQSAAAPQTAAPVASNLPLSEVAYAQTSASSETGNPTHQWQWWVGAALLALAAGLFYQTVRRKD